MPIIITDPIGEKGKQDAKKHRDRIRQSIKNRLPEIIGEETIITGNRKKTVRIPIRGLQIPIFRPKQDVDELGIGQGEGQPGDEVAPGDEHVDHEIETEVPIEELIAMMYEDLGLPNLTEKNIREIEVQVGWKRKGISLSGPDARLHLAKTAQAGMKRFWYFLRALQTETGADELTCYRALKKSQGILSDAVKFIRSPEMMADQTDAEIIPWPIIMEEDKRYQKIEESKEHQSNAVLIAMMDVSGSMSDLKKYYSRSLIFWLVEFLKKQYRRVEIRFIIHDTEAEIVDEEKFFHTREGGGTRCVSAYQAANSLIESTYSPDSWNIYVWHFSDGDDMTPAETTEQINYLLTETKVNMVGYGEIRPGEDLPTPFSRGANSDLWMAIKSAIHVVEGNHNDLRVIAGLRSPFLGVLIRESKDIFQAIKEFLTRDRWQHDA